MICLIMPVSTGLDAGVHESIDLVIAPYVRSLFKVYINMYWFASFDSPSLSIPLCVIDMHYCEIDDSRSGTPPSCVSHS